MNVFLMSKAQFSKVDFLQNDIEAFEEDIDIAVGDQVLDEVGIYQVCDSKVLEQTQDSGNAEWWEYSEKEKKRLRDIFFGTFLSRLTGPIRGLVLTKASRL